VAEVQSLPDGSANCLLINASPAVFGEVVKVLEQLDRPAHLVQVQVLIADTTPPDGKRPQGQALRLPAAGGFGGRGGFSGRGAALDAGTMFDRLAQGKAVLKRSELASTFAQRLFDRIAAAAGVTHGELTRDQWIKGYEKFRQGLGGRGDPAPAPPARNQDSRFDPASFAERRFKQFDRNGDGFLDDDEMPPDLKAQKEKWDTNHDGKIDLNEYKAFFAARVRGIASGQQVGGGRGAFAGRGGQSAEAAAPEAASGQVHTVGSTGQDDVLTEKDLSGSPEDVRGRLEALLREGRIAGLREVELVALENEAASMGSSASKPFVTGAFVSPFGKQSPTISYRSVGTHVGATPRVTAEGKIVLKLYINDSGLGPTSPAEGVMLGKDEAGAPIKASEFIESYANTQLTLTPGKLVVIAGVKTTSKSGREKTIMIVSARLADTPTEGKTAPAPTGERRRR
jgi:hypothetical protein